MAVRAIIVCDMSPSRPKCESRGAQSKQPQGFGLSIVTAQDKAMRDAMEKGWHKSADGVFCSHCWPFVGKLKANGKL